MLTILHSEQSPFFLMLLSSKAGGVGLTLTGGSRLILLEVRSMPLLCCVLFCSTLIYSSLQDDTRQLRFILSIVLRY
jgi:hypothetical protein